METTKAQPRGEVTFIRLNDDEPYNWFARINVGVCAGRHEMPVKDFVFDKIDDPTDVNTLEEVARKWVVDTVKPAMEGSLYTAGYTAEVHLYVTGLTVATASIMSALIKELPRKTHLILHHFDSKAQTYYTQEVW